MVVRGVEIGPGKLRRQLVIDHVVHEPGADVAVHRGLEVAIGLPEALDGPEGLLARLDADAVQEFVEIDVGKGRGRPRDAAGPDVLAPGEVPAQLLVVHRLVGGEVALELPWVGAVVGVVCHEPRLLDEEPRIRPGAGLGAPRDGAHLANPLREIARELGPAQEDGLVGVGALARERPAALGAACRENLLYDRVDVRHVFMIRTYGHLDTSR